MRLNAEARRQFPNNKAADGRKGLVAHRPRGTSCGVRWEGGRSSLYYHHSFLELATTPAAAAAGTEGAAHG